MIENRNVAISPKDFGADTPIGPQETFVKGVYSLVDEAIACELDRLRREEGIVPSCQPGCCHCCRYHILTNSAEAHTLAQYIRREFSAEQLNDLRLRTLQWHAWDNSRPGRHPASTMVVAGDLSLYEHSCPLDVNGVCCVYPVRPVVCRAHFVSSPPRFCFTANDPESAEDAPQVLNSVVEAVSPFSLVIREQIEATGQDFSRSQMLLPQWLAIEMGWDFPISA
ncbi:hypothetical protein [Thiovibrio frasassiensis]|uniref:Zinc/iron-chelating domain-containing protein n=1 Tax=Thiovibrio frasassiensis TaxID=2984131 RepID=A0A9X4MGX1_9BACT|nr:hypothetical protein [Thiovibrio frasassiensis]MDG4476178.1 hypothetical protein [Thiovibrio frasassiensis]